MRNSKKEAPFHKMWLGVIKKQLGSACTYISHLQESGKYFLKIVLKNKNGGKDTLTYELQGTPDTITSNDYQALLTMLKNKEYEQGSRESLSSIEGE